MKAKTKGLLLSALTLSLLLLPVFSVSGQTNLFPEEVCNPHNTTQNSAVCEEVKTQNTSKQNPISGPKGIISDAVNIIAAIAGIAAVLIIIYSGFVFVTAGGSVGGQRAGDNPARAAKARSTILYAVAGLAVVALSWTIVRFIIDRIL